ncbi:MAG: D-alanyl-D-alanine carboxypeptidase, partial [Myxococcales bacterium]|nr:D-alanyl-D-alanine carboxypeptidase [Myxococcales bacterium]
MTRRPFPRVRIAARHPGTSPFAVAAWFAMVAALGVLGEGHAEAQPTTVGSLDAELAELVRTSGLEGRVGIHVRDVQTDLAVFAHRADAPLHPASNAKVFTVYAALRVLGPAHRFRTAVYGATDAEGTAKSVALVGDGDPSLTGSHLAWLARRLRDRGLRHVRQVVVDESAFDDAVLPPGYGEQPGENAAFR